MTTTDTSLDWMISVDDHVIEPPGVWQDRVPAKYKDVAPRMVEEGDDECCPARERRAAVRVHAGAVPVDRRLTAGRACSTC